MWYYIGPDVGHLTQYIRFFQKLQGSGFHMIRPEPEDLFTAAHVNIEGDQTKSVHFLVKVFQGQGFNGFLQEMRKTFKAVASRKPDASRDRSPETYLLARGKRGVSTADAAGAGTNRD